MIRILSRRRLWLVCGLVLLAALAGFALGNRSDSAPGDQSVEAGFARSMSVHHAQAVSMADAIRGRTADDNLRFLATDIMFTQQNQIGRMQGWLELWGLSLAGSPEPMAWMGMSGPMPGMASPADISAIRTLPTAESEVLFLRLMRAHHEGGIHMADAVLAGSPQPQVRQLAEAMVTAQTSELAVLDEMLASRHATP